MNTNGFTLVELVVVIAIISIFTGVILGDYPRFQENLVITQAAQQVAGTLRNAENKSIVVAAKTYTAPNQFPEGYGLYFDRSFNE